MTTPVSKVTPSRVARRLYRTSPEGIVAMARRRFERASSRLSKDPITLEFLRSAEYPELMNRYVTYDRDYGLHEAETATKSFLFRAFQVPERLRAYRWRGIQENLDLILDLIAGEDGFVVDLGGAASPFGLASVIVDQLPFDCYGNPVPYRSLSELGEKADVVITSHTLEHIPELEEVLGEVHDVLKPGGKLVAHVPSFSCVRWRAGVHAHATFGDHVWTFGLSGTPNVPEGLHSYVEFDKLCERWFELERAEYCGDDSIFVAARRPLDA
jgi:SAM-dependent methyltransferase